MKVIGVQNNRQLFQNICFCAHRRKKGYTDLEQHKYKWWQNFNLWTLTWCHTLVMLCTMEFHWSQSCILDFTMHLSETCVGNLCYSESLFVHQVTLCHCRHNTWYLSCPHEDNTICLAVVVVVCVFFILIGNTHHPIQPVILTMIVNSAGHHVTPLIIFYIRGHCLVEITWAAMLTNLQLLQTVTIHFTFIKKKKNKQQLH